MRMQESTGKAGSSKKKKRVLYYGSDLEIRYPCKNTHPRDRVLPTPLDRKMNHKYLRTLFLRLSLATYQTS